MSGTSIITRLMLNIPWPEILANAWKYGRKLLRGLISEGMYEVLEYESTLELFNQSGTKAHFKKRKKVHYLQDNIIAFHDYAWGDGDILKSYQCTPGKKVDQYRAGYKTYILISLREVKSRGDIDEFNIQWDIKNGFLVPDCFWDTDISHKTKQIRINVIFPKGRHPFRITLVETNHRRTNILGDEHKKLLPDGRLRVTWEKKSPRLYEHYLMKWDW
jgi:hypothetical protein